MSTCCVSVMKLGGERPGLYVINRSSICSCNPTIQVGNGEIDVLTRIGSRDTYFDLLCNNASGNPRDCRRYFAEGAILPPERGLAKSHNRQKIPRIVATCSMARIVYPTIVGERRVATHTAFVQLSQDLALNWAVAKPCIL